MNRLPGSVLGLLLIAVTFAGCNLAFNCLLPNERLDLTEQQLYTLSPGTQQIIDSLEGPVRLDLYFSKSQAHDLVALRSYARRVEALLGEYVRQGQGRVHFQVIDPLPFSAAEDRAQSLGLQGVALGPGETPVYFGLVASNAQERIQTIALLSADQQGFLEYQITRLLQSLALKDKPRVGLLSGLSISGGFDVQSQRKRAPWSVLEEVRQAFEVDELPTDSRQIPAGLQVLMLVHPKRLSETTLYALDQFVLGGGRLLVFVDPYSEQDRDIGYFGIPSKDKSSGLEPLFNAWGLRLAHAQVLGDGHYGQFVNLPSATQPVWQPTALALSGDALSQDDVSTAGLGRINLSTAGMLEPLEGAESRFTPLLQSSEYAMPFPVSRFDHLDDPTMLAHALKPVGRRFTLAARIQGPASSAFPDSPLQGLKDGSRINVIVVADTDLLRDDLWLEQSALSGQPVLTPWADNGAFVLNALDSLAGSDALISLRSRGHYSRSFSVVDELRSRAERQFREMNNVLEQRLEQTEKRMAVLQTSAERSAPTTEQQRAIQQFTQEKNRTVAQMRVVKRELNKEIDQLGWWIKAFNIVLTPLGLMIGSGLMILCKSLRSARQN